jgi:predicted component of type VI protein secretion system
MMLNKVGVINQAKQRSIEIQKENPIRARAVRQARELVGQGKSVESVTDVLKNNFQLTDYAVEEIIQDAVAVTKELKKQKKEKITKISLMVVPILIIVSALLLAILH